MAACEKPPVSKVWLTDVSLKLKYPVLLWSRTSVVEAVSLLGSLLDMAASLVSIIKANCVSFFPYHCNIVSGKGI